MCVNESMYRGVWRGERELRRERFGNNWNAAEVEGNRDGPRLNESGSCTLGANWKTLAAAFLGDYERINMLQARHICIKLTVLPLRAFFPRLQKSISHFSG